MSLPQQVQSRIQIWENIPKTLDVMHLNNGVTMQWAAVWCGGELRESDDPELRVPTLSGVVTAEVRDYLIRDVVTGRFEVWTEEVLRAEYVRYIPEEPDPEED